MQEILRIHIIFEEYAQVKTAEEIVKIISFSGKCETDLFHGEILPGAADVQRIKSDGRGEVSAKYILKGVDATAAPCKIYVENIGTINHKGEMQTSPKIITDSEELKWLNSAQLTCSFETKDNEFYVKIDSLL